MTRDLDLLREIGARGGRVQVNMTVTTDDEDVRRTFEPGCPSNPARLKAIAAVREAGLQCCITTTPLLLVSDPEGFADSPLGTGVDRFIVQTFHFNQGEFVAQTRQVAQRIMAEKLECQEGQFAGRYVNTTGRYGRSSRSGCPGSERAGRDSPRPSEAERPGAVMAERSVE